MICCLQRAGGKGLSTSTQHSLAFLGEATHLGTAGTRREQKIRGHEQGELQPASTRQPFRRASLVKQQQKILVPCSVKSLAPPN